MLLNIAIKLKKKKKKLNKTEEVLTLLLDPGVKAGFEPSDHELILMTV